MQVDFDKILALPWEEREVELLLLRVQAEKEEDEAVLTRIDYLLEEITREKKLLEPDDETVAQLVDNEEESNIESIIRAETEQQNVEVGAETPYQSKDKQSLYERKTLYDPFLEQGVAPLPKYERGDAKKGSREMVQDKLEPPYKSKVP